MALKDRSAEVLVTTDWLAERVAKKDSTIRIIDATWHLPSNFQKRKAREEYHREHIPGALFFDLDEVCDKSGELERTLPTPEQFEKFMCEKFGVTNDMHVIVYDNNDYVGLFSAPRCWFMFKLFGHDKVSVLDGGLPKWNREYKDICDEIPKITPTEFKVNYRPEMCKTLDDVMNNIEKKEYQVIDGRPVGRFKGTAPEPRTDVKSGRIVNSKSFPFSSAINPETKQMKSADDIAAAFGKIPLMSFRPIIGTSGSGVTACVVLMAAYIIGRDDIALYPGGWTEWYKKAPADKKVLKGIP